VFGCRFSTCTAKTYQAGGLYIYSPPSGVGVQDCLFYNCSATLGAAGIFFWSVDNVGTTATVISYCLFHENTIGTSPTYPGIDIHVGYPSSHFTSNPCSSSYSTTPNSCYQNTTKVPWLGSTSVPITQTVNDSSSNGLDTYGCGIDEDWPCSRKTWGDANPIISGNTNVVDLWTYKSDKVYVPTGDEDFGMKCGEFLKPWEMMNESANHFNASIEEQVILLSSITSDTMFTNENFLTINSQHNAGTITVSRGDFENNNS
jgi:hypothetical protein